MLFYGLSDRYAYPATITKVDGNILSVRFDDGQNAVTDNHSVRWLVLTRGDSVRSKSVAENDNL